MSTETKDWIGDVEVFRHGGGGFGAAINGADAFHPAPLGDHNKPLCQLRIAHGLPSREAAEEAAREWVSRQAEALGLFLARDARIAELEAQVRTAGAIPVKSFVVISEDEDVIEVPDTDLGQALLMLEVARDEEPDKAWSLQAEVDADEARRLRGEGE